MWQIVRRGVLNAIRDRGGVTATEYTLMTVGLTVILVLGTSLLGSDISTALGSIGGFLASSAAGL